MSPKTKNFNAPHCFLHGHSWVWYTDGSQVCGECGIYCRPDHQQVNELMRVAACGRAYRKHVLNLPPAMVRSAPPRTDIIPLIINADGGTGLPSGAVLFPIAAFLLGCLGWFGYVALDAAILFLTTGRMP